ncbi:hypothetical protein EZV62_012101 [Acer yangbiense]|uniref:Integrase catalytic domain-containing protein n=1 Tax=Acer yangbiense TaxID=1000413 RepID=A0A5C7HVB9_9ROSI|nr:hypothetical protein EZV62_012101 [Acer yangbiense]
MLSNEGYRYYIVFIDAYTRYSWMYPLHLKSEALSVFIKFQKLVELQFERKIKTIQADMGGEYLPFVPYLSNIGVHVRFSCPYTHQQNGDPKRKHRSIVETGLTLLAHGGLPLKFWFEAFSTATILIDNLPTPLLGFVSPFEKLFHKKPNYNFFKASQSCAAIYSDVKPADSQLHKSPPCYFDLTMHMHSINNGQAFTRKNLISCIDKVS